MRFVSILLFLCSHAHASSVLFIVDGAHDWTAVERHLPPPRARALVTPTSFGAYGPESAASASEMATGHPGVRTVISPRGDPVGLRARARGIVTDACATDPTVASFFVRNVSRFDAREIAAQLGGIDVVLGGATRALHCTGPCCPSTRQELARTACPPESPLRGSFGNVRSALAGVCDPIADDISLLVGGSAPFNPRFSAAPRDLRTCIFSLTRFWRSQNSGG
jgi:hypothetical protein